jgi:F0F1-type ATP synthase membrane subunit b/b'
MEIIPELVPTILLTIPFLVTYALLHAILLRPLFDYLEGRDNAIEGARAGAEELHAKTDARLIELADQLRKARTQMAKFRAEARGKALAEESKILAKAREEAEAKVATAIEQIVAEQAEASKILKSISATLSADIVNQVLGREASA